MKLSQVFDVFSRKPEAQSAAPVVVPETTRNRVLMWCAELLANRHTWGSTGDYTDQFWDEIHRSLRMCHGTPQLSSGKYRVDTQADDAALFLLECSTPEFLDFLEYIFRVDCLFHVSHEPNELVDQLNTILRVDGLPFYLTPYVQVHVREFVEGGPPFGGREMDVIKTTAYPAVVSRDNEIVHASMTVPTLTLLQRPMFASANAEYLEALEDFRKGDYGDSLTKCGSALESVLKVVCHEKRWPYKQTDTASPLIKSVIENSGLESYFETPLVVVATLRNRLSKAHGAGVESREPSRHLAAYALNASAAAILLIVDEAGLA